VPGSEGKSGTGGGGEVGVGVGAGGGAGCELCGGVCGGAGVWGGGEVDFVDDGTPRGVFFAAPGAEPVEATLMSCRPEADAASGKFFEEG